MGLFDQVQGMLGGDSNRGALLGTVMQALNGSGGLAGLVQKMQAHGLGETVGSWVGTGENLPVSAEQVQEVLPDEVDAAARETGQDSGTAAHGLAQLLPQVVDALTPHGHLPEGNPPIGDLLRQAFERKGTGQ